MPGIPRLSLVEGAFEELAAELATYLDGLRGEGSTVSADITPFLADAEKTAEGDSSTQQTDKDEVLKKLVTASAALNDAPERELQAAYNLLIHLIAQSDDPDTFLPPLCRYLTKPITSSPHNGSGIALGILSTLFNTLQPDDSSRYNILLAITDLIKTSGNYETFRPQLRNLASWIDEWELDADDARKLYLAISSAASAHHPEESYTYLLLALRTLQTNPSTPQARDLSLQALRTALQNEKHFDFNDLTALDSIQNLRQSAPTAFELLELFSSDNYSDLLDFYEANPDFLTSTSPPLSEEVLNRKMRLLTLTSLASSMADTRTLPYSHISRALQIPSEDVEMWVIDCIRSGLVEGKLSQQRQEFLIHRCTHRNFGEKQWREVASRLETWKSSLVNVLAVIRSQKEEFVREKEQEVAGQVGMGEGRRGMGEGAWGRGKGRGGPVAVEVE